VTSASAFPAGNTSHGAVSSIPKIFRKSANSKRADTHPDARRALRYALEVRHDSFAVKEFIELLRAYDVALVCADTVEWLRLMDVTSDFLYCRLHGSRVLYSSGYGEKDLAAWARRVVEWASGREASAGQEMTRVPNQPALQLPKRDVYVYFDNDAKVGDRSTPNRSRAKSTNCSRAKSLRMRRGENDA
jgi:uncharacterized protein YecE (DUF72 family)